MKPILEYVALFELALAAVAIYLAFKHSQGLHRTIRDLEEIRDTLTTRYLDQAPKYFGAIVSLIAGAKESIEIICDFPAYGRFTAPAAFIQYSAQLRSKLEAGMAVQITCPDLDGRRDGANSQFGGARNWERQKATDSSFQKKLDEFLKHRKPPVHAADLDYKGFLGLFEAENSKMLDALEGANVSQAGRHIPVLCWIIDKSEAIFAFVSVLGVEHGFYTRDVRFIVALQEMGRKYAKGQ
jgi:hypothetical protein